MAGWHLGIIGGSGLDDPGALEQAQDIAVASAFGEPSGPVVTGLLAGVRCTFIARHGAGHRLAPSEVNYRANIDVLKRCGVTDVLAICAVSSLVEDFAPGDVVIADQLIDRTRGRRNSFFGEGIVAQVPLADPMCPRLSALAAQAAQAAAGASGVRMHAGGTYLAIEGPQGSTRAESQLYRQWGAQLIGMTAMPEACLAREAELPYALLGMVTHQDCWRDPAADVLLADLPKLIQANAGRARALLAQLAALLPPERFASPIDAVLDTAIITPREHWPPSTAARLDAVAGRLLDSQTG